MKTVTIMLVVTVLLLVTLSRAHADEPDQVSRGEAVYTHYCSTCHGDRGQGLTDEFRATWPPEDQNCWQSKCHALNHPPGGFIFPKTVPAVIGPDTLIRFETAQQLYTFIYNAMPYYEPRLLASDQYWDIAAFLLSSNKITLDSDLSADNAALIRLRPAANTTPIVATNSIVIIGLVGAAVLILALVIWRRLAARQRSPKNPS